MDSMHIKPAAGFGSEQEWLEFVRQQVASLRFGVVEIVVHDSRVTQIERTERVRFEKPQTESKPGRAR